MSRSSRRASFLGAAVAVALLVTGVATARAQSGGVAVAEVLFRDGRQLLAAKDYQHACPKLAESNRLDPATGTLLALAICHEREGKLASAWGEYADVAARARLEARHDRERAARSKVAELEPRLSTLTIVVPESLLAAGVEIRRNGVPVAPAWLGSAVPVDGGNIRVEVGLPGKTPWRADIPMQPAGDRRILTIPSSDEHGAPAPSGSPGLAPAPANLVLAPPASIATAAGAGNAPTNDVEVQVESAGNQAAVSSSAPPAAPAGAASPTPLATTQESAGASARTGALRPMSVSGIVVGVLGVVGVALAATATLAAVRRNDASKAECYGDLCTPAGKQDRRQALTYGDLATGGFVGGGMLIAAGIGLYIAGQHSPADAVAPARTSAFYVLPIAGPGALGGALQGNF